MRSLDRGMQDNPGASKMRIAITDLIPEGAEISIEDIGYLFFRYVWQTKDRDPDIIAAKWIERMNDVCLEEWGRDLDLQGILPLGGVS
jgi:hypothetical protein